MPEAWLEPLFDAAEMRATDAWAIDEQKVASLDLMEAAGAALAEAALARAEPGPARVVCGKGNNGGDGLVAARHLAAAGLDVEVFLLWPARELSPDAGANLERLGPAVVHEAGAGIELSGSGVVIDAIFGTGFEGAPRSPATEAIAVMNDCDAAVVAADIASGVDASTGEAEGDAVRADATVTFHGAKVGHMVRPGKGLTGELIVADIAIPPGSPPAAAAGVIAASILDVAPRRGVDSTKFSSGQAVVVGGSRGLTGAVTMSALAAIRAGAGYATAVVPADLEAIFEVKLTEVMSRGVAGGEGRLAAADADEILAACERAGAVVLGPGLGREEDSLELARLVASQLDAPLVLDADGLNAHAGRLGDLAGRAAPTVLTPHAGELGRLLDRSSGEIGRRRLACAREAASRADAIVVLKGDDTIVARPDGEVAVNALSSPALATAGTGDVLAGTIGALLARGVEPFSAAACGVHACTRAGVIAAQRTGSAESVIATDVVAALGQALAGEALE